MAESKRPQIAEAWTGLLQGGRVPRAEEVARLAECDVSTVRRWLRDAGNGRLRTPVARGSVGGTEFTVNQGRTPAPQRVPPARPDVRPCAVPGPPEEPPRDFTESPGPLAGTDAPAPASEAAPGQSVTTETTLPAGGPGPGDSIRYKGRAGPVWSLVVSVEDDRFQVRSGAYGRLVTVAASRVEAWEPGRSRYASLGGSSVTSYRRPR